MNAILSPKLILVMATVLLAAAGALAQAVPVSNPPDAIRPAPDQGREPRPNLLRELGLNRDQLQAIRQINEDRKPLEMAARRRFQNANRALNMAIYADNVDDADFKARLAEFQAAQAELAKIKFSNELAIRRVLTPAQLARFRELRRQFADERQEMRQDGRPHDAPPPDFRPARRPFRRPIN